MAKELFKNCLNEMNMDISELQLEQFMKFHEILTEKNKVMNLTGITVLEEVVIKHYIDSLTLVNIIDLHDVENIIDMGTGAGFPGVPIAIMFPHIKVTLMDSLNKRIKFLQEACNYCGIKNVDFVHGRAEDLGQDSKYREKYDLCVSRAVANLATLTEYCMPFVKVGGSFICYKAGNSTDEINQAKKAIKILEGNIADRKDFVLPESDYSRTLLKIDKIKKLSKAYPRKAGTPSRIPLI